MLSQTLESWNQTSTSDLFEFGSSLEAEGILRTQQIGICVAFFSLLHLEECAKGRKRACVSWFLGTKTFPLSKGESCTFIATSPLSGDQGLGRNLGRDRRNEKVLEWETWNWWVASYLVLVNGFGVTVFLDFISAEQNVWDRNAQRVDLSRPQALTVAASTSLAMDQRDSQGASAGRDRLFF